MKGEGTTGPHQGGPEQAAAGRTCSSCSRVREERGPQQKAHGRRPTAEGPQGMSHIHPSTQSTWHLVALPTHGCMTVSWAGTQGRG